ncbi:MAG: nuclear transport factor 2 family protein [Saprospiraceae bacterium]|nr:nuclear transport factor 2 family protein [Saprospiraceae bacterium]
MNIPYKSLGLTLLALLSCTDAVQTSKESQIGNLENIHQEEEVKESLINMWDAIEREDITSYSSYIHPDFTQFGESDSKLKIGREMEINGIAEWMKNSSNIHTEMEEPRVVIKGDVAWITYYWKDSGTTDGEAFSSRGKSTRIFVKEEGRWMCIHGHYTLLP